MKTKVRDNDGPPEPGMGHGRYIGLCVMIGFSGPNRGPSSDGEGPLFPAFPCPSRRSW